MVVILKNKKTMIQVQTNDPKGLLDKIREAIENNVVVTWHLDDDGDFLPTQEQWIGKAWITPLITEDAPNSLYFGIIESKQQRMTKAIYGVFLGRFAEMLLTHFDTDMKSLCISPLLVDNIDVFTK